MKNNSPLSALIALPEIQEFITLHAHEKASTLSLRFSSKVGFDLTAITQQIELRQKARKKIPSFCIATTILSPKLYEQSTHEEVAKFKAQFIKGSRLLDATAGLGIDAFYIGRNVEHICCLEANRQHAEILEHNFSQHQIKAEIINTTLEDFIKSGTRKFDVIYVDPDRRPGSNRKLFDIEQCTPNVIELKNHLLGMAAAVWIKLSPMMDIIAIVKSFSPNIDELHCISLQNEMKEILLCIKSGEQKTRYKATNLNGEPPTTFTSDKIDVKPLLSSPLKYLFEPNMALVKSKLCMEYSSLKNLRVLYPNGFYFTTDFLEEALLGRFFEIKAVLPYKKQILQKFAQEQQLIKANISCRNFFWKPEEVKKQLKLTDGGEWYLFCYTNADKKPMALWCQKIPQKKI